jgi:CRISPR-associated endonuclease Cas2
MSRTANDITLVCYDITSNKLRGKIDKCMKDFGVRLQFSVFMCRLDAGGVSRCKEELQKLLKTYFDERKPSDSLIIFERFNPGIADCLMGERVERKSPSYEIY